MRHAFDVRFQSEVHPYEVAAGKRVGNIETTQKRGSDKSATKVTASTHPARTDPVIAPARKSALSRQIAAIRGSEGRNQLPNDAAGFGFAGFSLRILGR